MKTDMYRFPSAPLQQVYLESGVEITPHDDGMESVRVMDAVALARALRAAILLKPARLEGPEIAYLRKRLDVPQKDLAPILGATEQTLSLWEAGRHPIPTVADSFFRLLCIEELKRELPAEVRKLSASQVSAKARNVATYRYVASWRNQQWDVRTEIRPTVFEPKLASESIHASTQKPTGAQVNRMLLTYTSFEDHLKALDHSHKLDTAIAVATNLADNSEHTAWRLLAGSSSVNAEDLPTILPASTESVHRWFTSSAADLRVSEWFESLCLTTKVKAHSHQIQYFDEQPNEYHERNSSFRPH